MRFDMNYENICWVTDFTAHKRVLLIKLFLFFRSDNEFLWINIKGT